MNRFTIKDIENLSGIKAHTWRMWEHRYGITMAQRKDSNHRFYDSDNLKQILKISYLYHAGIKISKIAGLNGEEMKKMALEKQPKANGTEYYINELIEASLDLDEERFDLTFDEAIQRMGIEETILKISYPFQERIGVLWLTDHVIPAQEHFTSNIIRQKLTVAIDKLPIVKATEKKSILLFTPEREMHELPLQFIYYLLKKNGNKVIYLGSNISIDCIETCSHPYSFEYLLFHLVTNLTGIDPDEYLNEIAKRLPGKKILMSGVQVNQVTVIPDNVQLLKSMDEVVEFTRK